MGKSNRTAALESKIAFLLGDHETKRQEIEAAERLIAELPSMRERLAEIETLINACEVVIKSDQPNWTRDGIEPKQKFTHKIPVRLGTGIRQALEVLRQAEKPMTVKQIAIAVLQREGQADPPPIRSPRSPTPLGTD